MKFVNLTPHTIKIVALATDGKEIVVEPSGTIARVETIEKVIAEVDGIPIVKRTFGEVKGIPAPEEGVGYIVSAMVLSAVKGRIDVYAPDTGSTAIRNDKGQIEAVTRLVRA